MHRCVLILLVAGLGAGAVAAQPEGLSRRFATANAAYEQGRYTRAVEMYEGMLKTGYASTALYYNLGNAYARTDRPGAAIRYYEKARQLRPDAPRIQHNLEQVRRRAGVYPERLRQGRTGPLRLVQGLSPMALLVAGGLLMISGVGIAVVWTRPDRPGGWRHPLAWGPVVAGLLLAAGAMGTSYLQSLDRYAVVVANEARLQKQPRSEAPSDTTLPEGALLRVQEHRPQWYEVRLANGAVGWVPARTLGDI